MARTIFGIFNEIMKRKAEDARQIGYDFDARISNDSLAVLSKLYHVSLPCMLVAYQLWKQTKFSTRVVSELASKATKLPQKDKVFLYNSLVPISEMAFENIQYYWNVCRGKQVPNIIKVSIELGVFDLSDNYFFNDKEFGFMSFNEIRNIELDGAIETWLWKQWKGE